MLKKDISKEMLISVYTNPKLSLKEKLKVLDCSDNYMYGKLNEYGIERIKPHKPHKKPEPVLEPEEPKEIEKYEEPKKPTVITARQETHVDLKVPDYQTYNLHLTLRFKPENKEDFFAAIELLKDMFK